MQDDQLIKFILKGGKAREEAVQHLINNNLGFIVKVYQKLGLSYDDAKDAYTDAILALLHAIEKQSFKGESKVSTFLYKIFYFKCVDLVRKKTTNRLDYMEEIPDLTEGQMDEFKKLLIREEVKQLKVHIEKLGPPCQQILLDWGFWGYKMSEIAERLGLADSGKAKRQKYICLQKLLKLLKK